MDRSEEAAIAFKHAADEIRFLKTQQWSMTNYATGAQVGVVAAVTQLHGDARFAIGSLCSASVAVFALILLTLLQSGIRKERARMYEARQDLPRLTEIHKIRIGGVARDASCVILAVVNVASAGLVILLIHSL